MRSLSRIGTLATLTAAVVLSVAGLAGSAAAASAAAASAARAAVRPLVATHAAAGAQPSLVVTPAGESAFHPLPPARLLDTRTGNGAPIGKLGSSATLLLQVRGRGGVPAGASAVVLNVTVTGPTKSGFLTVFPSGTSQPTASTINFTAGATVANGATAALGSDGKLALFNFTGQTDVVLDVTGYYSPSTMFGDGSYVASVYYDGGSQIMLFNRVSNGVPAAVTKLDIGRYQVVLDHAGAVASSDDLNYLTNSISALFNCTGKTIAGDTTTVTILVTCASTTTGTISDGAFRMIAVG
jgi:hypothetical protein